MKNVNAAQARKELRRFASAERARTFQRFFKTGPGEYAEGDQFVGVVVPDTRTVAKRFRELPLSELETLLNSKIHEERLLALIILVLKFQGSELSIQRSIAKFYMKNISSINNWDLVDVSAEKILGPLLLEGDKQIIYRLARSKSLWKRRIALLTTFHFIKNGSFDDTLKLAAFFLKDREDLIHKATGWMLREIGKRDVEVLEQFLGNYANQMPRTMLRYAIEKFSPKRRVQYLKGLV